ncbi:unnamed protein product [Cyclocybe aegerita]|uniref:Uncharacterized protein n=1 Tax=Cyclocybe aegerita TaxID=1973307 RepID=A0A8S0WIZ1_CYCAE|nr:unnamed protein product [Cyclocybe aegerita]
MSDRSIWNILWSCFATIVACTWISVHPNVPGASDSQWKVFGRRMAIMMYLLIAPEMVILWAARQHFAAVRIAQRFRDKGWTTIHGFFLIMGGFELYDGRTFLRALEVSEFAKLHEEGRIEWPSITAAQIEDRSKADFLSKGIVIVQTTWFIVQMIGRGANRLAVTELEVVTLAFAALNGVTYWLWWDKPMDVRCPVPVHLKGVGTEEVLPAQEKSSTSSTTYPPAEICSVNIIEPADEGGDERILDPVVLSNPPSRSSSPSLPKRSRLERLQLYMSQQRIKRGEFRGFVHVLLYQPLAIFFRPFEDMLSLDTLRGDRSRVPTFYAPKAEKDSDSAAVIFLTIAVVIVFGAIHCVAWSSSFPTVTEKWLWRVNSVAICTLPLLMSLIGAFASEKDADDMTFWEKVRDLSITIPLMFFAGVYIVSRVSLLVQPLAALRALPSSAYEDLDWTNFLPHTIYRADSQNAQGLHFTTVKLLF